MTALEYAPNKIRINAVAPTIIQTEAVTAVLESAGDDEKAQSVINDWISWSNPMVGPGKALTSTHEPKVISFRVQTH